MGNYVSDGLTNKMKYTKEGIFLSLGQAVA
jgi:hypothetical protein